MKKYRDERLFGVRFAYSRGLGFFRRVHKYRADVMHSFGAMATLTLFRMLDNSLTETHGSRECFKFRTLHQLTTSLGALDQVKVQQSQNIGVYKTRDESYIRLTATYFVFTWISIYKHRSKHVNNDVCFNQNFICKKRETSVETDAVIDLCTCDTWNDVPWPSYARSSWPPSRHVPLEQIAKTAARLRDSI